MLQSECLPLSKLVDMLECTYLALLVISTPIKSLLLEIVKANGCSLITDNFVGKETNI